MKNLKQIILMGILVLGILFLLMDKCGSSRKYNRLQGKYDAYRTISKTTIAESKNIINKQAEEIKERDEKIISLHKTIKTKDKSLVDLDNKVTDLEDEFSNLDDKDAKIVNLTKQVEVWKKKFSISQSIIRDKDEIIFSLTEQYQSQLCISNEYKKMYESVKILVITRDRQIKELEKINKRLRFGSGIKTGLAITLAGLVVYSLLRD